MRDIEKLIGKKIPVIEDHPFPLRDHNPTPEPKRQFGRRHSGGPKGGHHSKGGFSGRRHSR